MTRRAGPGCAVIRSASAAIAISAVTPLVLLRAWPRGNRCRLVEAVCTSPGADLFVVPLPGCSVTQNTPGSIHSGPCNVRSLQHLRWSAGEHLRVQQPRPGLVGRMHSPGETPGKTPSTSYHVNTLAIALPCPRPTGEKHT